jgi:hypothetical protein
MWSSLGGGSSFRSAIMNSFSSSGDIARHSSAVKVLYLRFRLGAAEFPGLFPTAGSEVGVFPEADGAGAFGRKPSGPGKCSLLSPYMTSALY